MTDPEPHHVTWLFRLLWANPYADTSRWLPNLTQGAREDLAFTVRDRRGEYRVLNAIRCQAGADAARRWAHDSVVAALCFNNSNTLNFAEGPKS